jgi:hypothetical protein
MPQIEWWGGLLLIWGAGCYLLMLKTYSQTWSVDGLSTQAGFITAALLVLGWFHPLASPGLQKAYLGVFGLMLLALPLIFFWPAPDTPESEPAAQSDDKPQDKAEDDEELSPFWDAMGQGIFLGPVLIGAALGAFKSWQLAHSLGWLA